MLKINVPDSSPPKGEKWKACRICSTFYKRVVLKFDSGSVAPTVDEVLTGATSGDTGVVTEVFNQFTGTYAGGDAEGYVEMSTCTGVDEEQGTCFQDNETINGSVGGNNIITANGAGILQAYGILWPKSQMVKYRGHWYCREHYGWRTRPVYRDDLKVDVTEKGRGAE